MGRGKQKSTKWSITACLQNPDMYYLKKNNWVNPADSVHGIMQLTQVVGMCKKKYQCRDLNPGPPRYILGALPTELPGRGFG